MTSDITKYKNLDQTIQKINAQFITPEDRIAQAYVNSFKDFFDNLRKVLYSIDPVLNSYHKTQYAGSTYDSLVVGTYKEFDMQVLINLPDNLTKITLAPPGGIQIKLDLPPTIDAEKAKTFKKWQDTKNYITPDNFRMWGEGVIDKSLNELRKGNNYPTVIGNNGAQYVVLKTKKSGPAFTLTVKNLSTGIGFDVDVVFCLEFSEWPKNFPNFGVPIKTWKAVPKTPKSRINDGYKNWRYSFSHLEKQLLAGGTNHLRSTIKLMKKLRDAKNMSYLASYHIKTVFLLEVDNQKWNSSLGYLFVTMIKKLKEYVEKGNIPFYWDKNLNLLDSLNDNQKQNCIITLNNILRDIEKCVENPDGLKKILLTQDELKIAN